MPATTSVTMADGHSNPVLGFTEQNYLDPFLPLSSNEEQLTPYNNGLDPATIYATRHILSRDQSHTSVPLFHDDHSQKISSAIAEKYQQEAKYHTRDDDTGSEAFREAEDSPYSYNAVSPVKGFPLDSEYHGLDEYATQGFENDFLFEATFGPLPVPEDGRDAGLAQDVALEAIEEPSSATSTASLPVSHFSRKSTGLATLSSHLMSPVLTETTSPGSGEEAFSPIAKTRLLGGGRMSRHSSQSTATEAARAPLDTVQAKQTPDTTASSVEQSPEPLSEMRSVRDISPVFRIESYTRGDSPARTAFMAQQSGSKRSRTNPSSYLAASDDYSTQEDDDHNPYDDNAETGSPLDMPSKLGDLRPGLDPQRRSEIADKTVLNFQDHAEIVRLGAVQREVQNWLTGSDVGLALAEGLSASTNDADYQTQGSRRRAKSAIESTELERRGFGWGFKQTKEPELGDSSSEAALKPLVQSNTQEPDESERGANCTHSELGTSQDVDVLRVSNYERANTPPERKPEEAHPWVDPVHFPSHPGVIGQPPTSNAAMVLFATHARDIETASRAATWGTTNRRMSEADLERIVGPEGLFSRLSISRDKGKDKNERRASFLEQVEQAAARLIPRRNNSNVRRKASEPTKMYPSQAIGPGYSRQDSLHGRKDSVQSKNTDGYDRKDSLGNRTGSTSVTATLRRIPSASRRPKSPKLNTGGAVAAVATQLAAMGANGCISPTASSSQTGAWQTIIRTARGEFHRNTSNDNEELGLAELWNRQGGPPLPTFKSTPKETEKISPLGTLAVEDDDPDSDDMIDEKGMAAEFSVRHDPIVPTYEGFKNNVRTINPQLAPYLIDRIGQEQLRRYKKLVGFKVKHAQAKQFGNCESGEYCVDKGGVPKYLTSTGNQKEPVVSHSGFSIRGQGEVDEDEEAVADGLVSEAQFPQGVPVPPVKRLPAQFECPLCFTVKSFHKPSDWSKHVHEDLQPFTCTFPICPDPKSFKRKADWVRHENERHRQLEWWTCTEVGCAHQCYRRDNFVQHLVREHKMPEPKAKNTKPNKPAVRGPAKSKARFNKDDSDVVPNDRVMVMVETCRHVTTKQPMDEHCRFCGIVCNSWKKLTVHLARHMEMISMPVLGLVRTKEVAADMIISPIEPRTAPQDGTSPGGQARFHRSNSMIGPLDVAVSTEDHKKDFHGTFTPIPGPLGFPPARYENQALGTFSWGNSNNFSAQNASQVSPSGYARGGDNAYISSHTIYDEASATHIVSVNHRSGYIDSPPETTTEPVYSRTHPPVSQTANTPYPPGPSYGLAMEHQTNFAQPSSMIHFMNANNGATSQPQQVTVPAQFCPVRNLAFTQSSDEAPMYIQQPQPQNQHQHQHQPHDPLLYTFQ